MHRRNYLVLPQSGKFSVSLLRADNPLLYTNLLFLLTNRYQPPIIIKIETTNNQQVFTPVGEDDITIAKGERELVSPVMVLFRVSTETVMSSQLVPSQ